MLENERDAAPAPSRTELLSPKVCEALMANGKLYSKKTATRMVRVPFAFSVKTPEGTMTANDGDFLAVDANGGFYPISADIQEQTYRTARPRKPKTVAKE